MTLASQMAQIERSKTNFRGLSLKRRLLIKGTSKQNWHLFEGLGMMIIQYFQKSTLMFNRPRLGSAGFFALVNEGWSVSRMGGVTFAQRLLPCLYPLPWLYQGIVLEGRQ